MWHSALASTGSDRSRLQPPSAVSVAVSAWSLPSASNPTRHAGVEAVALARHRHVLGAVEPQPDGTAGERGAERGDRREAVRLHLLAAERAAHPQTLHGDLVARQAQHVRDDLLRLARVLGAGLDEHLPVLVDQGERRVRFQVEVLLPGELELAREHVGARVPLRLGLAAAHACGARPGNSSPRSPRRSSSATAAAHTRPRPSSPRCGRLRGTRRAPSTPRARGNTPPRGRAARRT